MCAMTTSATTTTAKGTTRTAATRIPISLAIRWYVVFLVSVGVLHAPCGVHASAVTTTTALTTSKNTAALATPSRPPVAALPPNHSSTLSGSSSSSTAPSSSTTRPLQPVTSDDEATREETSATKAGTQDETLNMALTTSSPLSLAEKNDAGGMTSGTAGGNPISALVTFAVTSIRRTADSCTDCWRNHGRCNAIRQKQNAYREAVRQQWDAQGYTVNWTPKQLKQQLSRVQGGITYEEYAFLQTGKDDRMKVFNLIFLMWGAPRILPYALMINKQMLPSPFVHTEAEDGVESPATRLSRQRAAAVIQTLLQWEEQARQTPAFAKLNILAKNQQAATRQKLTMLSQVAAQHMTKTLPSSSSLTSTKATSSSSLRAARQVLQSAESHLYRWNQDFSRAEQRFVAVPSTIIRGLRNVLDAATPGWFSGLQPTIMMRGRLVSHVRKVADSDEFLCQAGIDLQTIPPKLLQEACQDRLILATADSNPVELQQYLQDWLTLTVRDPAKRIQLVTQAQTTAATTTTTTGDYDLRASTDPTAATTAMPVLYYNSNLARLTLMGYYSCVAARDARNGFLLPRLLYGSSGQLHKDDHDADEASDDANGSPSSQQRTTPKSRSIFSWGGKP